jgi:hypothetical protein
MVTGKPGTLPHPGWMRERESPPRTTTDLIVLARRRIDPNDLAISLKQHGTVSKQIDVRMGIEVLNLSFKPIRIGNVVGIHPRNILTLSLPNTLI